MDDRMFPPRFIFLLTIILVIGSIVVVMYTNDIRLETKQINEIKALQETKISLLEDNVKLLQQEVNAYARMIAVVQFPIKEKYTLVGRSISDKTTIRVKNELGTREFTLNNNHPDLPLIWEISDGTQIYIRSIDDAEKPLGDGTHAEDYVRITKT